MMIRRLAALSTAVILAVVAVQARPAQSVTLRYHWTKGDVLRYRITQQNAVALANAGGMGPMNIDTTLVQMQQYSVQDVAADGAATVKVKFESIHMDMNSPMASLSWDSATPGDTANPLAQVMSQTLGPLVGESVTLIVTPLGAVQKIDGLAEIAAKMNSASPAGGGMSGMPGMTLLNEDSLRGMLEQSYTALPERAVAVGETWNHSASTKAPFGTVQSALTLTLKSVAANLATVAVATTNKVSVDPAAAQGATVTLGNGTGQGELVFDTKAGRVQRSSMQTTQPMSMSLNGMSLDATTNTHLTVELVK